MLYASNDARVVLSRPARLLMCYSAEQLEVSGVLAVVTTGLVMSFYARGRISPGVEESMHTFWSMATYVANTAIFFVSGLIIGDRALFDDAIEVSVGHPVS